MKKKTVIALFGLVYFLSISIAFGGTVVNMSYTVSMDEPNSHTYQVELQCGNIKGESIDLKMPAITPGYYRVIGFAKNVRDFSVEDKNRKPLEWEKTGDNTWQVKTDGAESIVVKYDIFANGRSVAESSLSEDKGYICPTNVFMYIADELDMPAVVTIKPHKSFSQISTGLDIVEGKENTFCAENFDRLYDCPIFVSNQEIISFDFQGIEHKVAIYEPGEVDREKLISILKKIVEAAVSIVGEIPYKHYTFIMMGEGLGGLEHSNSMAVFTEIPQLNEPEQFSRWLSFIAHEFFHLYNVKRIRPIALGPFNYDGENKTNMLWLSEGGTVYYEYIILNRAGFMDRDEVLQRYSRAIRNFENSPANEKMTVAEASYDAWTLPFFGGNDAISYYDKGTGLCILLDLKIRHEKNNEKSLDDVMQKCYQKYFKELKRGFTDEEFRTECEKIAGCSLEEFFDYVYTTNTIDYEKYLGYAGLRIEMPAKGEEGRFTIEAIEEPDELQKNILEDWLK